MDKIMKTVWPDELLEKIYEYLMVKVADFHPVNIADHFRLYDNFFYQNLENSSIKSTKLPVNIYIIRAIRYRLDKFVSMGILIKKGCRYTKK